MNTGTFWDRVFEVQAHLLDVLVLIDAWCEGRGEALIDIWLVSELFEHVSALLCEQLLLVLLVQPVQTPLVRLAEVYGVDVGLVHGLHLALSRVYTHGGSSVDTCVLFLQNIKISTLFTKIRREVVREELETRAYR